MSLSLYILHGLESQNLWLRKVAPKAYAFFNLINATFMSIGRLMSGGAVAYNLDPSLKPEKTLVIYEFESCPFCKLVRETLNILDLDYIVYPCPRTTLRSGGICGDSKYRPVVQKKGGKLMFPYFEDPNTGVSMYESNEIIKYLWETYGKGASPDWKYKLAHSNFYKKFNLKTVAFSRPCLDMGMFAIKSKTPEKLLELWGHESSPFVTIVKETLCSLEIPYIMHTMGRGDTQKRKIFAEEHKDFLSAFRKSHNMVQIPFLKDPNTNVELFESADIVKYLKDTYQIGDYPSESWLDYNKGIPETANLSK